MVGVAERKALAEVETRVKRLSTLTMQREMRESVWKIRQQYCCSYAAGLRGLTESFKEKVKAEYPGVDTLCGYYGSISYKLANMSSQSEIRSCLLKKEFEDGRTEIRKGIKARKNEMIKRVLPITTEM